MKIKQWPCPGPVYYLFILAASAPYKSPSFRAYSTRRCRFPHRWAGYRATRGRAAAAEAFSLDDVDTAFGTVRKSKLRGHSVLGQIDAISTTRPSARAEGRAREFVSSKKEANS